MDEHREDKISHLYQGEARKNKNCQLVIHTDRLNC